MGIKCSQRMDWKSDLRASKPVISRVLKEPRKSFTGRHLPGSHLGKKMIPA